MGEVLELLTELASKGIKLSFEGADLKCYAPKGSLTKEISDSIARHKPEIVNRLRDYVDFQASLSLVSTRGKTYGTSRASSAVEERRVPPVDPPLDLAAEATLDPDIQPPAPNGDEADFTAARTILLTGASGFLGAYLLYELMKTTEACVYCLVRCRSESDGAERIKKNLLKYGLWNDDFAPRVIPVPGDLAQPLLGLGTETFDKLCDVIDTVYHNGAVVNFIYSYNSLKDSNVRGTQEVIRLACRVKRKPMHFISTIGVFPPTTKTDTKVLESSAPTNWQGLTAGYPQSKWVAERMVMIAAERGLPVRIYRPGFVTGDSTTGIWNTDDFLARMIKGCIQLGSAPDMDAMIEMVPVDYVSKAIVHLSRQPEVQSNVFHVVGRRYIPVGELFRIICSLGYKIVLVPYPEWRKLLFDDAKTSSKNALYPLLTGFAGGPPLQMPAFDCRQTLEGLKGTQLTCPEIDTNLIGTYLTYLKDSGFLDC